MQSGEYCAERGVRDYSFDRAAGVFYNELKNDKGDRDMENARDYPLFYFSGTGGCLAAARRISEELPEYAPVPIAALRVGTTVDADAMGLVFPLYFAGMPRIVAQFVAKLRFARPCRIFAVVACGFPWSGWVMHQLNGALKKKGQKLASGFYLPMVDNFLPHYDVPPAEKLDAIYKSCGDRLTEIIGRLRSGQDTVEPDKAFYLYPMYPVFISRLKKYDRHFTADGRCNGCGLCKKVCPVNNVTLADKKPVWHHSCEFCHACISYCPQKAIQWKKTTQAKGRYHYRGVSAADIMRQKLPR